MTWFDDSLITAMRADVANMLPDTAIIKSSAWVTDGEGGGTITYSAVGTVACRLDPKSQMQSVMELERETLVSVYQLTVPYDANLAIDYRVTVGGLDYDIVKLDDQHSGRISRRAWVSIIK